MIDYHCHLLPGLDDGARTLEDSVEMARLLATAGFREICCTPHHLRGVWDNTPQMVREATAALQLVLENEGIALKLHPCMEYYLDEFLPEILTTPLTLPNGSILVEFPANADPQMVQQGCFRLVSAGHKPLIAHPERTLSFDDPTSPPGWGLRLPSFLRKKEAARVNPLLLYLRELGCAFQGNLGSHSGLYGPQVQSNLTKMVEAQLYTCWGSDGHNPRQLERILRDGNREKNTAH